MSFYDAIRVGASGAVDFEIERSLRFDYTATPQLKRTGSSTSSTYTVSMWYKYTGVGRNELNLIFSLGQSNDANSAFMGIDNNDHFVLYSNGSYQFTSTRDYRDPGAWYHFTLSVNSNSYTLYINNESIDTGTIRSLDTSSDGLRIGIQYGNYYPFNGYIADFYLIDGLALTPSSFTETNAETGQLIPKKYSGSFGTSGAHLLFNDNSGTTATTLGKDSSGNGNNFTPSGFSVATGSGNDSVIDTPTNNFPIINPLTVFGSLSPEPTNGALDFNMTSNNIYPMSTFLIPESGKWYAEVVITQDGISQAAISVTNPILKQNSSGASATHRHNGIDYYGTDIRVDDNNNIQTGVTAIGVNNTIGICVDRDADTVLFKNNNSNVGVAQSYTGTAGSMRDAVFAVGRGSGSGGNITGHFNFGQRPFTYDPPTGFKALCSANLPDPAVKLPNKHFDTVLYSGDGNSTRTFSNVLEFQPDWFWTKIRNAAYAHLLYDSVRGAGQLKSLASQTTGAEGAELDNTTYGYLNSFDANGFSVVKGSAGTNFFNESGKNYVTWNWNAGETDSATYRVVVVSDSGNKYRFRNSANTATFAQSAVTLDLAEGGTYTFDQSDSTMSSHPMKLSTTANGTHGGGSSYNTGVTYELDGSTVTESAFVSGFSSATSRKLIITVAASAPTLYYYCHYHSGMGGQANTNSTAGSSNFDGSIQTTVKANTTAGFSIVTYTGTGSAGATIGHGLGVKPDAILIKRRDAADNWMVYHNQANAGVDPEDYYGELNSTSVNINSTIMLNDTAPTSTSITLGGDNSVNGSSATYVSYVFSEVDGYSKFNLYFGNFQYNGTMVYTGFRPAWLMVKQFGNDNWYIVDNKRDPFNVMDHRLFADTASAEGGVGQEHVDFLSNGFKWRRPKTPFNNTFNYLYFCFAEAPFKNSRAR